MEKEEPLLASSSLSPSHSTHFMETAFHFMQTEHRWRQQQWHAGLFISPLFSSLLSASLLFSSVSIERWQMWWAQRMSRWNTDHWIIFIRLCIDLLTKCWRKFFCCRLLYLHLSGWVTLVTLVNASEIVSSCSVYLWSSFFSSSSRAFTDEYFFYLRFIHSETIPF